jgi:hypothetical protein
MRRLVSLALLLAGCRSEPTPAPPSTASAAPSAPVAIEAPPPAPPAKPAFEPPLEVDIKTLLAEYKANEIRADATYKGKLIRVSGVVSQVGKGLRGEPFVALGTGATLEIPSVQCFLADPADPLASDLNAGGKATVRGRVERLLGNVMVKGCEVNPVMRLCMKLKEATGAQRCATDAATGDANGILFEGTAKSSETTLGVLGCFGRRAEDKRELPDYFPELLDDIRKSHPKHSVVGSARTFCYLEAFRKTRSSDAEVTPELRAKTQAFFDAL